MLGYFVLISTWVVDVATDNYDHDNGFMIAMTFVIISSIYTVISSMSIGVIIMIVIMFMMMILLVL